MAARDERDEIVGILGSIALFADLTPSDLDAVAHTFDEEWFEGGRRIIRQGFSGTSFYVILDGEAAVRIDGEDRSKLARGDFFGEISILLGEPPTADIVALTPLRCMALPGSALSEWLLANPSVLFRILQAELRRLRNANRWRN